MDTALTGKEDMNLNDRPVEVGMRVHYTSPFLPADGSERKCLESVVTRVHPEFLSVDISLEGVDENGNDFSVSWVMFRGLNYGYWSNEKIKGFQPHSWHYPENDEIRDKNNSSLAEK